MNLGTDSIPDTIKQGVKDPMEQLDGEMDMSADRLGEGHSEEVQMVNEVWVVTVPGDAIIIRHLVVVTNKFVTAAGQY